MKGAGTAKAAGLNHCPILPAPLVLPTISARLEGQPTVELVNVTENGCPVPRLEMPATCKDTNSWTCAAVYHWTSNADLAHAATVLTEMQPGLAELPSIRAISIRMPTIWLSIRFM